MTAPARRRLLRRLEWASAEPAERDAWIGALRPGRAEVEVGPIIDAVRRRGDAALRDLTTRHDGVTLDTPWVDPGRVAEAPERVAPDLLRAIDDSIAAVRRFHADQLDALRPRRVVRTRPGVVAWRRWAALERIGAYVPGGRAALASSAIMTCLPARMAGVDDIVIASPPDAAGDVAPAILAVAARLGIERVLRAGGAQAIAALAYGTESVTAVDRIVGAGNAWVTAAKRAVSADVAIDLPAGPSECVIIADADADPELVALDLMAQAEHGPDSVAVLVTDVPALADAVDERLAALAGTLATGSAALETLDRFGGVVLVADVNDGLEVSDAIAPEHLSLQCVDAAGLAERVRNAGAVFVGRWSAVAAGDYATGTNHVLPTGGAARAFGGLGIESFGRWIEVQRVESLAFPRLAGTVDQLAAAEGLPAHGRSVTARAERAAQIAQESDDPVPLMRRPEAIAPYPAEPSDEALAEQLGVPVERIGRYDMNTMPVGPWSEYGDLAYDRLRAALADATGVPAGRIVPGAGADELIRLVTTMAVGAGDAVVIGVPTFAMFAVEARLAGARVVSVPRERLAIRQPADLLRRTAEKSSARLVWLCTPNNPTGDAYRLDEIRELADGLPALVVVDEVYLEFAAAGAGTAPERLSAASLQDELPNVIVLRSLSKAYGLAGARIGYLVVPEPLADRFAGARLPLSISAPSEAIALEALGDPAAAAAVRGEVIAERDRLSETLAELGAEVLPSVANFVTFRPPDADALATALERRGLILRRYGDGPLAGWLRATARPRAENERLLDALREYLA